MTRYNSYSNRQIDGQWHIWLQSYGWAPAKPAGELKVGDETIWNWGYISTIVSIDRETEKTIWTTIKSNGKLYDRKFSKSRLVAIK